MPYRLPMLRALRDAARAVGDRTSELEALSGYCAELELRDSLRSVEAYREFQIRYDVETLKKRNLQLETASLDRRIASSKIAVAIVAVALVVLIGTVAVMRPYLPPWRRSRQCVSR